MAIGLGDALLALLRRDGFFLHRAGSGRFVLWCFGADCLGERERGIFDDPNMTLCIADGCAECSKCGLRVSAVDWLERVDCLTRDGALQRLNGSRTEFYRYLKRSRMRRLI